MTRCLAPDCQMGGLGCDNMTVVLVCYLNGKTYEDLAAKCAQPLNCVNQRQNANGHVLGELNSEGGSPDSSCSSSTAETPDEETPPILSLNPIAAVIPLVDGDDGTEVDHETVDLEEVSPTDAPKAGIGSPPDGLALA